jgi:hypothetical protein
VNRIACIAIGTWLLAGTALAAPVVSGKVSARNGTPLADVQVQVEIRSMRSAARTDAQGSFRFDAATLFSAAELGDASGLMLRFSKPGFEPANKMVRLASAQAPGPVTIQLDPTGGSAALAAAERQTLDQYAAAPGSAPLFLVPYSLAGISTVDPKKVNEMLRANLERVIVTHLQASAAGTGARVSLKLLPVEQMGDIDRLRAYGNYLNALGVITGYGAVEPASGRAGTLGVSSTFLIVPRADTVGAPVLYVDDDMPADRVASPRLYKHLSKLWGRSTVLALGVSEFGKAKASGDKQTLRRIRAYLQSERAGAGPGDEALVSQLNGLIAAVDQELAK